MKIKRIRVRQIFDSRGEPTIEVCVADAKGGEFCADVPSGKSRGSNEAVVLPYEKVKRVNDVLLARKMAGKTFKSVRSVDETLVALDGTFNKRKLGGDLALGVSVACARALAHERGESVWRLVRREFFKDQRHETLPLVFSNLINGGAHSANTLDIQEYMIVMRVRKPLAASIEKLIRFDRELGAVLKKKYRIQNLATGDEEGYSLNFRNNEEPIKILASLIAKMKLTKEFSIGLDVAASSFYKRGAYVFEGKPVRTNALLQKYLRYLKSTPLLFSLEDPFSEKDYAGFSALMAKTKGTWVVGDDLTTTNQAAIERSTREGLINAVIIKPNQIGTVTETCGAIRSARKNGVRFIVSHRSGETEDAFIIHLARAANADGVKIGAPAKERMLKFNELVRVYE